MLRDAGRLREKIGGSFTCAGGDGADERLLSIQGLSAGIWGVVYWESAAKERSQRFGAQTPTRTRQAAMTRFRLFDESVGQHSIPTESDTYCI